MLVSLAIVPIRKDRSTLEPRSPDRTVAWQQALEPSDHLQRVTMWIYLVAIIFVGIFGESKTLEYILLFVAFSLTMLLRRLWLWRNEDKRRRP